MARWLAAEPALLRALAERGETPVVPVLEAGEWQGQPDFEPPRTKSARGRSEKDHRHGLPSGCGAS